MSDEIKPMTDAERRWWRRLCRVLAEQPPETWLFAASGQLTLLRTASDGSRVMTPSGGVDHDWILTGTTIGNIEGGDF